jgi:hypothetical protein
MPLRVTSFAVEEFESMYPEGRKRCLPEQNSTRL